MTDTPSPPDVEDDADIDALLSEMSLEAKVGQLVGTYVGKMGEEKTLADAKDEIRDGVGNVSPFGIGISTRDDPVEAAETANALQRVAVGDTDHGIPLTIPVDATHGHAYLNGASVFPHNIGIAAARNEALAERGGRITGEEMAATGATLNYGPTCDVARDQRWGRVFETFGESSLLCGDLAAAQIRGLKESVGVTAKHFPAYGRPERGEDASVVEISESTLRRRYLPAFEPALEEGVDAVMPCYNSINGEPAHSSERLLTDLLRGELDHDGPVVSDWGGVDHLYRDHRTAEGPEAAAWQAFDAGLDVVSVGGPRYAEHLLDLVEAGELSEERIAESARRVLRLKRDAGLFEDPYVDPAGADPLADGDHIEATADAARESMTLLENDGTLPLSSDSDVLVTGPNADDLHHQFGGWSVMEESDLQGTTVKEGVERVCEGSVTYEKGASITEREDIDAAADAAEDADAAVVVLGEDWYIHEFGPQAMTRPTGEWPTRTDIGLADAQQELLERVHATGTPTVLVLISGRPLSTPWAAEHVSGILMAYYPGMEGGTAVAETLFGEHNPSGTLPVSVPRSAAHLPTHFDYLRHPTPIGDDEHPDSYDPLYPFGHGLSYTDFEVGAPELSASEMGPEGSVTVEIPVENVGDRAGEKAVDLFVTDEVSSRVTANREHVGFGKVQLAAGERGTVALEIAGDDLAVRAADYERTEPGTFTFACTGGTAELEVVSERGFERR